MVVEVRGHIIDADYDTTGAAVQPHVSAPFHVDAIVSTGARQRRRTVRPENATGTPMQQPDTVDALRRQFRPFVGLWATWDYDPSRRADVEREILAAAETLRRNFEP